MAPTRIEPAATLLDWTISKGDDYSVRFPVLDAVNQAVTVTGWTAKAQVRRSDVEPVLHEWTTEGVDPNASTDGDGLVLELVGAVTSEWGWQNAQFSIELTEPPDGQRRGGCTRSPAAPSEPARRSPSSNPVADERGRQWGP